MEIRKIGKLCKLFGWGGLLAVTLHSCSDDRKGTGNSFDLPPEGVSVLSGHGLIVKMKYGDDPDSVVYSVDSVRFGKENSKDKSFLLDTKGLTMGVHLLTANVYSGEKPEEITYYFTVLPEKAPVNYSYKVVATFPHDTSSYTEGLIYQDGILYESDGEYDGASSIRTVHVETGKIIRKTDIPGHFFGEGITVIGDTVNQLTYQEHVRYVYDKKTLKKIGEHPFFVGREGWGMTDDGQQTYMTDGSHSIYRLDRNAFIQKGYFDVYDNKGPVEQLNELEYINGKLFANVYTQDYILIIDPKSGAVEGKIDLSDLYPPTQRKEHNDTGNVLNGIAWDAAGKRLFVTGKKWDKLFVIKLEEPTPVALLKR